MDWKSIIRVSLKLFAFLCGLLFALPLGLLLWGMYAAVSGIWRLVAQRRTSDAHEKASTRPGSDAWQHEEGNNTMACMRTAQEAPGVPLPEAPATTPVHRPPEDFARFWADLDERVAPCGVVFSIQEARALYTMLHPQPDLVQQWVREEGQQ
jgi:hypothetical protein